MTKIGEFGSAPNGALLRAYSSNVGRGNTSSTVMFTTPAGFTPIRLSISGLNVSVSNAGTSARISIGSSGGGGKEFLADFNVKTNGAAVSFPSSFVYNVAAGNPNPVSWTAIYAEDGAASNAGGPWLVTVEGI